MSAISRIKLTTMTQKILSNFLLLNYQVNRNFSRTHIRRLKEIVKTTSGDGKTITIEGVYVKSPREDKLIDSDKLRQRFSNTDVPMLHSSDEESVESKKCALCRLGLEIKHTDVLIIQQFLDPNGLQLTRKVTGLCMDQHRRMDYLIQMAKLAGILKTPADPEPTTRPGYMKYNKYYEESVIDEFFAGTRHKA